MSERSRHSCSARLPGPRPREAGPRPWTAWLAVLLLASLLVAPADAARRRLPPPPPNIVVIMTDDQRWDTLQHMPNVMDLLANQGVVFTNSFATSPLCWASRAGFLTGSYARNGASGLADLESEDTIAFHLQNRGYATGLFGKYVNGYGYTIEVVEGEIVVNLEGYEVPPGWDTWRAFVGDASLYFDYFLSEDGQLVAHGNDEADYSTDVLAAMVVDFIRDHATEPFFAVYTPYAPHAPATPAPRHAGSLAALPPWRPPGFLEADTADKPGWVNYLRFLRESLPPAEQAEKIAEQDQFRIRQLETLAAVDEAVGTILAELDALDLADRTIVVFTSDNGLSWNEHWWNGKFAAYEESVRTPLVIRAPQVPPGQEDRLALNIDLGPTFAELAGVASFPADGASLVPLLDGSNAPWRDGFLLEHWWHSVFVPVSSYEAVRTPDWKYVRSGAFEELYHLAADPDELDNLVVTSPADPTVLQTLDDLRSRLDQLTSP